VRDLFARVRAYLSLNGEAVGPIAVLFALNAADELDTYAFNLLGPEIAREFDIGVGLFTAITVLVGLLVPLLVLPVAHAADRRRRMPMAIAAAATWGAFSLLTGLAPALWVLILARVGSGFGRYVNEPIHAALVSEFYSPRARVKAFGIHSLANPAGIMFGAILAGFVADQFGWRAPFFVLAVPTFVLLVMASRLREPPRGRWEAIEAPVAPPLRQMARRLWAVRSLRYQWIGLAYTTGAVIGVSPIVQFFLEEDWNLGPGQRSLLFAVGTALTVPAVIVGTTVMQRRIDGRPSDGMRILCWSGLVAAVALVILPIAPSLPLVVFLIWVILAVFAFVTPGLLAVISSVAPPEIRASAFALGRLVAVAGVGWALLAAIVADWSLRWGLFVMAPVFLRGVLYFFQATRYLDDDVERLSPEHAARAAGESPVLLEVKDLTVSYGGVRVLFGVDLEIRRGEVVALLGTNGAGKSTTLNAISGIVEPDGGNVWFDGEPITGEAPEHTVARGIVQVPGGRGVFPGLTVEENLRMGAFLLRRDRAIAEERLGEALAMFPRLGERRRQRAGLLSGGERQMLTLAQSFLLRPKLLLIDELSLGLAPTVVRELLEAVRRMNAAGVTIVLVEQSVNVALTLAERAYFMEKGEVRFSGPTSQLLKRPDLLRSVFLEGARTAR
jgi:ABC-type branched-subunit amino acid transport system ATPase component/predicted MFS family arabinose efflux permease